MNCKVNSILKRGGCKSNQKGMALILFAFLMGLAVTGVAIKFLSAGGYKTKRSVDTMHALAEAKAAIVGYVLSGQSSSGVGIFPCAEDTASIGSSNEGQAGTACSTGTIGRFAWRSVGTGLLTDGNKDKLWYALSAGFRTSPINSDNVAGLSVDGTQNEAIALLFSSGAILSSQSRPVPTSSSPPVVTGYLDAENSDGDIDFITGPASSSFNDRLIAIKPDDIFPVIEKQVLGEFKNYLNAYKATWGAFPFPATFGDPTAASYLGVVGESGGLLPISNINSTLKWNTASTPVPIVVSPMGNIVSAPSCSFRSTNTRIRCDITIYSYNSLNPPSISISGTVNNIGLGFYDGLDVTKTTDIQITTRSGSATVASASRAFTHSLNTTGQGIVTFAGVLANTGVVRIEYRRTPPLSSWVLDATDHYLLGGSSGNNWHHLVYYKVATPFLPGGNSVCGVSCLTINAINVTPNISLTNKHALVMIAGRKLNTTNARPSPTYGAANPAQDRPGSSVADYFDSTNNISGGLVFDSTNLPLVTFNDQIQIIE